MNRPEPIIFITRPDLLHENASDMLNIMQNPAIIQLKYEKMEAAFKKLL
jgi:hypothetical protein|nr:MAG TPA: hypothetical protein [Caudoviricetes sp.]